jgi:ubiquinone/menaquinone biosynthesis C-methylase UbiE
MNHKAVSVESYFDGNSTNWDEIYSTEGGAFYNYLNRRLRKGVYNRAKRTLEIVSAEKERVSSLLDIGCGSGRLAVPLAAMGIHVTGIDFAKSMIDLAIEHARNNKVEENTTFIPADFMKYPFPPNSFDISIAMGVFDYIADPKEFMEKMKSVTSYMMLATYPIKGTLRSYIRKIRLNLKNCPVYYYSKEMVLDLLATMNITNFQIDRVNNQYYVKVCFY